MLAYQSWMSGRFGVMIHYLPPLLETKSGETFDSVDACVSRFNVPLFMEQLDLAGADYLIFTLGQNTGMYNSPNAVLESRIGAGHCAIRDLAGELAGELKRRKKRFIAYLPMEAHCNNRINQQIDWVPEVEGTLSRQEKFQKFWLKVVREWAVRFGSLLDGWFFDGAGCLIQNAEERQALFDAARSGNPHALVCMNFLGFDLWDGRSSLPGEDFFPEKLPC